MRRSRPLVLPPAGARAWLVALAAGLGLLVPASGAAAMTGTNLVVGGDGETPVGAAWTPVAGSLVTEAYGQGGYPNPVLIGGGTFAGGTRMLHPAGAPSTTVNTQLITLGVDDQEAIDTGTVRARTSAYLGGYANQADRIGVEAQWRDASGTALLTQTLAPVTNVERGNVSGFLRREDLQAVPAGARSLLITVTGQRAIAPAHDGYLDDLRVQLIGVPRLQKAFGAPTVAAGQPVRLTYTVANSEDGETKPPWTFTDELPAGLAVSSTRPAATTCGAARLVTQGGRLSLGGELAAGQAACTATLDVVAAAPGTYETGARQVGDPVGLLPPTAAAVLQVVPSIPDPPTPDPPVLGPIPVPPLAPVVDPPAGVPVPGPPPTAPTPPTTPIPDPPPTLRPALRAQVSASRTRVRAGSTLRLRLRVTNGSGVRAARVRACQQLPRALAYAGADARAGAPRGRRCWTAGTLAPGATWSTTVTVRARGSVDQRVVSRLRARTPGAVVDVAASTAVRIVGKDTHARR